MDEDGNVIDAISIHAPHARSDPTLNAINSGNLPFQSTLLMRGATRRPIRVHKLERNFNPRSSCEERLAMVASSSQAAEISIHAPHARSDGVGW